MHYAVIASPQICLDDLSWIQSIRSAYDPQFNLIEPHFTLVFPCDIPLQEELVYHVRLKMKGIQPFHFNINKAFTIKDPLGENFQLFLVPQKGSDEIKYLHDILYTGFLSVHLRSDIPYVPHITIANRRESEELNNLEKIFNGRKPNIEGTIDRIEVICIDGENIQNLEHIHLGV